MCSLCMCVMLVVFGCGMELKGYICGVFNNGVSFVEICEVLLYSVLYVGVLVVVEVFCSVCEVLLDFGLLIFDDEV